MVILLWINDSVVLLRMYSFGYPVFECTPSVILSMNTANVGQKKMEKSINETEYFYNISPLKDSHK